MAIKINKDELVYDGKYIQTVRRHFTDRNGVERTWDMVKRNTFGRIVAIAAITDKNEIIMEKIYRIPCEKYIYELPAGLMDKPGESEIEAITRELLEETGYKAEKVELLSNGPFNTGLVKDEMAIYLGLEAKKAQEPELEAAEDIEVFTVPLANLFKFISENQKDGSVDLKIASIIPFLKAKGLPV